MNKLVESLLNIEHSANKTLAELEEERADKSRQVKAEIARSVQEIRNKTNYTIDALKQNAKLSLATNLAEVEHKHKQETAQLQELFHKNAATWRKEWAARILDMNTGSHPS